MVASANELRYFLEIGTTLNFSRAAERLGVTQPALSQAIARLEKGFGQPLFVRTRTGVVLTKTGIKLYSRGRRLLTDWEELLQDTLRDEAEVRGTYTLGCHPSVGLYALPQVLPELLKNHPELGFSLTHDLSRKVTEQVIGFKLDFGIVINPVQHAGLVIRKLGSDTVRLWTSEKPSSLQDLHSGSAVLLSDPDLLQTQDLMKRYAKAGLTFGRYVASSNLEVIASLVAGGAGVGILPGRVATRVAQYGLRVAGDYPTFADTICLIYRSDTHLSQAAKILARSIAAKLQGV